MSKNKYNSPKCESAAQKGPVWMKITLIGVIPLLAVLNAMIITHAYHEEQRRQPFVKYEYMRIRHKRFPWGEGDKSFFHNPSVNALPDGYEMEE